MILKQYRTMLFVLLMVALALATCLPMVDVSGQDPDRPKPTNPPPPCDVSEPIGAYCIPFEMPTVTAKPPPAPTATPWAYPPPPDDEDPPQPYPAPRTALRNAIIDKTIAIVRQYLGRIWVKR